MSPNALSYVCPCLEKPYNFERLLYYLTDENHTLVKQWMTTMDDTQKLDLPSEWLQKLQCQFRSARITDDEMCETMREVHNKFEYYMDPHTSVAFAAARHLGYPFSDSEEAGTTSSNDVDVNPIYAILSTASPCKFQEAVTIAIGKESWEKYHGSQFPTAAREVMEMKEIDPVVYDWPEGESMSEVQAKWEQTAKNILQEEF